MKTCLQFGCDMETAHLSDCISCEESKTCEGSRTQKVPFSWSELLLLTVLGAWCGLIFYSIYKIIVLIWDKIF